MPTLKQKAAFDILLENKGKPVGEVMLKAGYDPDSAKNPKQLTESKGFIQLMEEHGLDDLSLAKRHKELLQTDDNIAIKALDLAYKVKGSYAPDKSLNLNINADLKQDPKTREIGAKYEAELLNTLASETE